MLLEFKHRIKQISKKPLIYTVARDRVNEIQYLLESNTNVVA